MNQYILHQYNFKKFSAHLKDVKFPKSVAFWPLWTWLWVYDNHICALVRATNIESILAVMNTSDYRFYIGCFDRSAHVWFSYTYSHYSPFSRFIWIQHNEKLPVGLLTQLVERCTGIKSCTGLNFLQALFRLLLQ